MSSVETEVTQKWCCSCFETKPLEEFNKDKQKTDGLRNYCRECEKIQYKEKKQKKELSVVEDVITDILTPEPKEDKQVANIKEVKADVDTLAKIIVKNYGEDRNQADEIYDVFMQKIAGGDNSQASKEALTKSLELKMNSNDSITKLIQIAAKLQETREKNKGKGSGGINVANLKDNFNIED